MKIIILCATLFCSFFTFAQAADPLYSAQGTAALYYPYPAAKLGSLKVKLTVEGIGSLSFSQKKNWRLGFLEINGENIAIDVEPLKKGLRLHLNPLAFSRMVHTLLNSSSTANPLHRRAEKLYEDCFYRYIVHEGHYYPCGFERRGMALSKFNDDYVYEFAGNSTDFSGFFRNEVGSRDHLSLLMKFKTY